MRENTFTIKEVAALLKTEESKILNLIDIKKLEYFKVHGKIRVTETHILNYLKYVSSKKYFITHTVLKNINKLSSYFTNKISNLYKNFKVSYFNKGFTRTYPLLLNNLALLREVDMIEGVKYNSDQLKKLYPDKIVIVNNTDFICRGALCRVAKKNVTLLENYVHLGELSDYLKKNTPFIKDKIASIENDIDYNLFEFIMVANIPFVKITKELEEILELKKA